MWGSGLAAAPCAKRVVRAARLRHGNRQNAFHASDSPFSDCCGDVKATVQTASLQSSEYPISRDRRSHLSLNAVKHIMFRLYAASRSGGSRLHMPGTAAGPALWA
jgi:hypothetical protein